ncbi:MAG TPA: hypothetical protein DCE18_15670 [Syntrophobacteraceae bacterium]|nr:hypothetical protein [Syntrophobacteraceae bacterium]
MSFVGTMDGVDGVMHPERREQRRRHDDQVRTADPCDPATCLLHPVIERGVQATQAAIYTLVQAGEGRERDVKWLIKLGRWLMATAVTLSLFFGGISITAMHRYADEMRQRDATRLVLINDIAILNKVAALNSLRLDGIERSVADLTAQFRAAHMPSESSLRGGK